MKDDDEENVRGHFGAAMDSDDADGQIPEATPLLQPARSARSQIATDEHSDLLPDTDVDVDDPEDSDTPIVSANRDADVKAPEETHDLRALATTGNKMSENSNRAPNFCSVDVVGPDGIIKRFAPGTKAAFAVERFNCQLRDPALPVVCIVAYKDGEDPIEFGPNVELVSYDNSWTLKTLREGTGGVVSYVDATRLSDVRIFSGVKTPNLQLVQHVGGNITVGNLEVSYWSEITGGDVEAYDSLYTLWAAAVQYEDPIHRLKDTIREGTAQAISSIKPVTKVPGIIFGTDATNTKQSESTKPTGKSVEDMDPLQYFGVKNWEDLYPGGKLPEGGAQDCSPSVGKVLLMFIFIFAFAGGLSYMLERLPDPTRPFY